jgi:CheY-like chemotaxis protein
VPLRCLLVDDSPEFLASATRLLQTQGVDVVACASTGVEALRLAEKFAPEVALVDVQLGDEDGFALTRRLAAVSRSPFVVLISSHPEEELEALIAESPAVGFLAKRALSADAILALLD